MERGGEESVSLVDVNHPSFCENAKKKVVGRVGGGAWVVGVGGGWGMG